MAFERGFWIARGKIDGLQWSGVYFGNAAGADGRGQVQNWIDFSIAVIGGAGPIS